MRLNERIRKALGGGMILSLMVFAWIVLAPAQFGGQSAYVMVAGASMEPTLHRGDLVVVRETQNYEVGDVVTYRHPTIGPIIHRIIDRSGERFIFKGDNNEWIDSYEPVEDELIGKEWLHIPGAASVLLKLRMPAGLALLSLATALIVMITLRQNALSANEEPLKERRAVLEPKRIEAWSGNLDGIIFALGALALGAFLLGLFAFLKPMTIQVPDDVSFEHQGRFDYQRGAPPSIYDGGMLTTGDPVFHQLVPVIDLEFDYHFVTQEQASLSGRYQLSVQVGDSSGWQRTIELIPATDFEGNHASLKASIDVAKLVALTELLRERTGYQRQVYTSVVRPEVYIEGTVGGVPFQDSFTPQLAFQLDDLEMYLLAGDPVNGSGDPLTPGASGFITRMRAEPATISILGLDLTVESARWIAGVGFAIGMLGIAAIMIGMRSLTKRDPMIEILLQYGALLVEVEQFDPPGHRKQTEIHSMQDLAKLAERTGNLIFHAKEGDLHKFQVRSNEVIFNFELESVSQGQTANVSDDKDSGA
jgi:signal peptidase